MAFESKRKIAFYPLRGLKKSGGLFPQPACYDKSLFSANHGPTAVAVKPRKTPIQHQDNRCLDVLDHCLHLPGPPE